MTLMATAAENRTSIKDLLSALDFAASELGYDFVAELLDTDVNTLRMKLDGDKDITLAELQQLAIATDVKFTLGLQVE